MSKFMPFVALSLLISAAPAFAGDKEQSAKAEGEDALICKKVEITGSLVKRKKVCATAKQWNRQREDSRREAESSHASGGQSTGN